MATYDELLQASEHEGLKRKMRVAVVVAAETIRNELGTVPNHAARLVWAKQCFQNPDAAARDMMWPVLAQNKAATLAAITGADDAAVQTAVNAAVDVFAT
jgi:hypothetical protein